jgi:hypothetical protein
MLRGRAFSKGTSAAGMLGNGLLMVIQIIAGLEGTLPKGAAIIALAAGISIVTWYILVSRRLRELGRS